MNFNSALISGDMKYLLLIFLIGLLQVFAFCNDQEDMKTGNENFQDMNNLKVLTIGTIKVGTQIFKVTYYDNPTSRSLVEQMPFATELEDYAGIEKIFYPNPPLNKEGTPKGADPSAGDIMYYAPWGDVPIFYKDFRYADDLIPVGHMEDISGFAQSVNSIGQATFELEK